MKPKPSGSNFILCHAIILLAAQVISGNAGESNAVPLYGHAYQAPEDFTEGEYEEIARRFAIFTVEKRHAHRVHGMPGSERAAMAVAKKLKAINPKIWILMNWNSILNRGLCESQHRLEKIADWRGQPWRMGNGTMVDTYDLKNEAVRKWWLDSVIDLVTRGPLDGVFLDAVPKIPPKQIPAYLEMLAELRRRVGEKKLIVYNGFRVQGPDLILGGLDVLEHTSGVFVEAFFSKPVTTKERGAVLLEAMSKAAADGKVVIARGSPAACWGTTREDPTFALAAFLITAGPESYFCYNWGYNIDQGTLADFEVLNKRLGAPRRKAMRKGWVFTRDFEHARVRVDLEKPEAEILWK